MKTWYIDFAHNRLSHNSSDVVTVGHQIRTKAMTAERALHKAIVEYSDSFRVDTEVASSRVVEVGAVMRVTNGQ